MDTLTDEIEEASDGLKLLHRMMDMAKILQPGDELPAGMRWPVRDHRWWIWHDEKETGVGISAWAAH